MKIFSAAAALFLTVAAMAQTTNGLSNAEVQGRNLARQLADTKPSESTTNSGTIKTRGQQGYPVRFYTIVTETNWLAVYEMLPNTNGRLSERFVIAHYQSQPNEYDLWYFQTNSSLSGAYNVIIASNGLKFSAQGRRDTCETLSDANPNEWTTVNSFAQSDFSIADLGLEFLHWPAQKILKKESRRTRPCMVLESTNPNPSTNGYSRVLTWIDNETLGPVFAEAYDAKGKLLKEFEPKDIKKVNGQWQLESMEIRNVQTRSRTRIEFDLKKK
jgi:hypothetical protein